MPITQILLTATTAQGGGGGGGAADFTIEWWQKVEDNGQNARPWSVGLYSTQVIAVSYEGLTSDYYWINSGIVGNVSRDHRTGQWEHMAFVRRSGTVYGYVNGEQYFSGSNTDLITDTSTPLYVGTGEIAAGMYQGYLTDLHIIKGVAKYTGNFTPPTAPITSQSGSVFLLSAVDDGTKYVDSVGGKIASLTGTVPWNSDSPYLSGNGSLYFNSNSYLDYGGSVDWAMDV